MATAKKTAPAKKTSIAPAKKTSTAVATRSTGAVSVQAAMQAQLAKLADKTAPPTGASIRVTQDKQFALPDGTKTRDPLTLVIVDFQSMNRYYPNGYDKDNITPPACAAVGEIPINLVPFNESPERQSETCKDCPQNQWNSDPNGGKGKACKNTRVLAVLPPDADADTAMWTLAVSPTGIKAFDGYVNSLQSKLQAAPFMVTTEVSMDDGVDYPSLRFGNPQLIEDAQVFADRIEEANKMLTAPIDFSGYGAEPAKPAKKTAARSAGRPAVARR